MTERPFYEAEILMLVCLYFPYDVLPGSVSSVLAVRESRAGVRPVPGSIVLKRKILFLGSWAQEAEVISTAKAWIRRLAALIGMDFDCQIAEPPFTTEDLDCRGFWFNIPAQTEEKRVKMLRKQIYTGLSAMLQHATRWKPDLIVGYGQGGLLAALAALPLVVEAACRTRVTPMEVMREYRETWAVIRGVVAICPLIMPQRTSKEMLCKAVPEALRLQPSTMPREIMVSKNYQLRGFAKELGAMIAAPVRSEEDVSGWGRISSALARRPPLLIEDGDGSGLCCICSKQGALGRCPKCGLLMHHSCVQPILPGRPQPCPACDADARGEVGPPTGVFPHEMEVGAPRRRAALPFVGVDAGAVVVTPCGFSLRRRSTSPGLPGYQGLVWPCSCSESSRYSCSGRGAQDVEGRRDSGRRRGRANISDYGGPRA